MAKILDDYTAFELDGSTSYTDIHNTLLDYAEALKNTEGLVSKVSKFPVHYKDLTTGECKHIGYVLIEFNKEKPVYIIRHYTLENVELKTLWHPVNFYKGDYEIKNDGCEGVKF
ncbi:hypothetical protein Q9K88_004667 [Escherichia coli]|nr:hypothetical protein [Escherichia coli]